MKNKFRGVENRQRRRDKILRLIFLAALTFTVLGVLFWNRSGNIHWDHLRRFSFIFETQTSSYLISISPADQVISVISINPQTYIEAVDGLGTYKVSSIYKLGELKGVGKKGGELLAESIQQAFGVPIEAYIYFDEKGDGINYINSDSDWRKFRDKYFGVGATADAVRMILAGSPSFKTNLNAGELFSLYKSIQDMGGAQLKIYDLASYEVLSSYKLPDKSKVLRIDPDRLDKILDGVFADKKILDEGLTVGVMNASRKAGVAGMASRIMSSMGTRVVSVGNVDEFLPEACMIKGTDKALSSYTVGRINEVFSCIETKVDSRNDLSGPYDVEFMVGEGYRE